MIPPGLANDGRLTPPGKEMWHPHLSEGFLLDEDNALRRYLMSPSMEVFDSGESPRKVGVWFGHPDREVREQRYPYIIVSLIDVSEAKNRTMSGARHFEAPCVPLHLLPRETVMGEDWKLYNGAGTWSDVWYDKSSYPLLTVAEAPIPVQVDYSVRVFSRHPRHDRQIFGGLLSTKFSYRYSWLPMGEIDGSHRRLELLSTAHMEEAEDGKRLFVSVLTVRVDGFMPSGDVKVIERDPHVSKVIGTFTASDLVGPVYRGSWTNTPQGDEQ